MSFVLLIGAAEERQVVLVDVLGDVEAVGLDQLLVVRQLVLEKTEITAEDAQPQPRWGRELRGDVQTSTASPACSIFHTVPVNDRNRIINGGYMKQSHQGKSRKVRQSRLKFYKVKPGVECASE